MKNGNLSYLIAKSKKHSGTIKFVLNDENLAVENYECVGLSNSDYGT